MIVLAIDPGSVTAGFALLKKEGKKITYLDSGILKFKKDDVFLDRIKDIHDQTKALLEKCQPDVIALESLIFVKSPSALIKLAQSRGAMLSVLTQTHHQKIFEYSPNLIKSTVTGHGHADKEGVQKIIQLQLGISEFKTHDESDALAIALCHLLQNSQIPATKKTKQSNSLASALAHKFKEPNP